MNWTQGCGRGLVSPGIRLVRYQLLKLAGIFGLEVLGKLLSFIGREYLIFPSKSIDNKQ